MHGFACSHSVRPMWRRRLLLALGAFAVFALPSVLAIAAPARADTVTDWNATAAAALQSPGAVTPPASRRRPGRRLDRAPGDGPRRRLRRGQRDRRRPRAVRLLARGRAVVLAGRRGRGRRAARAHQRRARRPRRPAAGDRGRLPGHARRDPARARRGRRHRHGRGRRDRVAGGARRRRPLRRPSPSRWGRCLASGCRPAASSTPAPGCRASGRSCCAIPTCSAAARRTPSILGRTPPSSTR